MVISKSGKFDVCNLNWHSAIARAICQPSRCSSYHFCIFFPFFFFRWLVCFFFFFFFCFASQLSYFNPSAQKSDHTLTLLWRLGGYEHPFTFILPCCFSGSHTPMHCLAVQLHNFCLPQSRTYFNIGNALSSFTLFTSSFTSWVEPMGFFSFLNLKDF